MSWHYWEWPTIKIVLQWLMGMGEWHHDEKIEGMLGKLPEWPLSNSEEIDDNDLLWAWLENEALVRLADMIVWNFDTDSIQRLVELLNGWAEEVTPVDTAPII